MNNFEEAVIGRNQTSVIIPNIEAHTIDVEFHYHGSNINIEDYTNIRLMHSKDLFITIRQFKVKKVMFEVTTRDDKKEALVTVILKARKNRTQEILAT